MNDYRINISYAKALLMTADEMSSADKVAEDMRLVNAVCRENRVLTAVFANPVIRADRKAAIVGELFGNRCGEVSMAAYAVPGSEERRTLRMQLPIVVP